jgi:hypothetical protein
MLMCRTEFFTPAHCSKFRWDKLASRIIGLYFSQAYVTVSEAVFIFGFCHNNIRWSGCGRVVVVECASHKEQQQYLGSHKFK